MNTRIIGIAALLASLSAGALAAQTVAAGGKEPNTGAIGSPGLGALVAHALEMNPAIRAAADRVEAARARIAPAGVIPDPWVGVGVTNLPLDGAGFNDMMAMKMVGVAQTIPFPGKLGLQRRIAERQFASAEATLAATRLEVGREVKEAYYEAAFLDRALEVLERSHEVLVNFIQVTESRYSVGVGGQQDVLKARVEAARLGEEAVALAEQRRSALAQLNAALNRPSETPVESPEIPSQIALAAVAESPAGIRFVSSALGARAAGSPLPPLAELHETAVRENRELRAHEAMIDAQEAVVALARKEHLPDFDLSLQYGQRNQRPDMVSAMVSMEIPIQKGRKQDLLVKETEAELSALRAEHKAKANAVRARVVDLYTEMERDRAQLALYVKSIIPQGRAALTSATTSFQVGKADFLMVLENQATLYDYETAYFRGLTDFARKLAELEQVVGKDILR